MVGAVVKRLLSLLVLLAPGAAHAHVELNPQLVNRYASFLLGGSAEEGYRLEAFVAVLFGEVPGADERRRMDRDGDGVISPAERDEARRAWVARAGELFTISVDGEPLAIEGGSVQLGNDDGVGPAAVVVELFGARDLPAGERRLRVEPRTDLPRLGETEIALDLAPGWVLVAGGRGPDPGTREGRVKFDGPRVSAVEDRSVTFVVRTSGAPGSRRGPTLLLVAAALVLAATLIVTVELRRRRPTGARTDTGS